MANPIFLPLQEKIPRNNIVRRVADLLIFFLLLSFLLHRLLNFSSHGLVWKLAFLCETCFTFIWVLNISTRWNTVDYKTYPDRFLKRFEERPALDMFVTTADSSIEPPIKTMNTVLSLLAVDYPANKLACYVSDDGGSIVTFYALIEASKFAKLWVPFCKKYSVGVRAPFMYFSKEPETVVAGDSRDFLNEWRKMKNDYEELSQRISEAAQKSIPCNLNDDFMAFYGIERGNHASIVKVVWENKDNDPNGLPHIIYVSREKRPKYHHNFKAGALNVLMRISGIITNAPFILNVDCDMFTNNPQMVLHAMCLLFGFEKERESAFVQFPQQCYDRLKDDPFGTSMEVLVQLFMNGMAGIQGPIYGGTGCFHRRKVMYGLLPDDEEIKKENFNSMKDLQRRFGYSTEFAESVAKTILGTSEEKLNLRDLSSALGAANEVSGCQYEFNTSWGQEVGLVYGSTNEDVVTGMKIHARGFQSAYCDPEPPAFLGCTPSGGPSCMTQQKRWSTGLLQIFIGKHNPLILTFTTKLRFRQCLGYVIPTIWALRSIPELCYSLLVAFSLLTNTAFLPKVSEPTILIPTALFTVYNIYSIVEYRSFGFSLRGWWNNERMSRIITVSAWLFGAIGFWLDLLGISPAIFEVTRKEENTNDSDGDAGRFTFDSSPIFVPGVTLVFVHTTALVVGLLRVQLARPVFGASGSGSGSGPGEILCSMWVLLSFLPFVKGLFRKGSYGIPWPVIFKAAILALFYVRFVCAV